MESLVRENRAVMITDVSGFTKAAERRESAVFVRLREDLDTFRKIIELGEGKVIADRGDGIKAEFSSSVRCLECAIKIQEYVFQKNLKDVKSDCRLVHRVGLHSGDFIVQDGNVSGIGAAIAARLEQICPPGKIAISDKIHDDTVSAIKIRRYFLGAEDLKNLNRTVKVWIVQINSEAEPYIPLEKRSVVRSVQTFDYRKIYRIVLINDLIVVCVVISILFGYWWFIDKENGSSASESRAKDVRNFIIGAETIEQAEKDKKFKEQENIIKRLTLEAEKKADEQRRRNKLNSQQNLPLSSIDEEAPMLNQDNLKAATDFDEDGRGTGSERN